jgi:hypothetical protein
LQEALTFVIGLGVYEGAAADAGPALMRSARPATAPNAAAINRCTDSSLRDSRGKIGLTSSRARPVRRGLHTPLQVPD